MTGPEHYRDAEQFASASVYAYQKWGESGKADELKSARWQQAQGQLHATLAVAAATADAARLAESHQAWAEVRQ